MRKLMALFVTTILVLLLVIVPAHAASTHMAHAQANSTAISFPDFSFAAAGDWGCSSNTNNTI